MPRSKARSMLRELLEQIDHDIAKDYDPGYAEEPEEADYRFEQLVDVVGEYIDLTGE